MRVGLIDVDSHNFPNLVLMKLSAYHKSRGDQVEMWNGLLHYDRVYQSKVFDDAYSKPFEWVVNADEIIKGGNGYDLKSELPNEIEHICPDYSLYGIKDKAYGYLTRGCPRHCPFCIVGANDQAHQYKWYLAKATDSTLYAKKNSVKVDSNNFNGELQGKVVAVFGDSLIGNTRDYTSTPSYIAKACGATVYNFGFGGCRMSVHETDWDDFSMYNLADDIYNDDFTALVTKAMAGFSGMPGYFRITATRLGACDFSKVDAIIIAYGTNDYRSGTNPLDNPNDKFDTSTVCGALRYSIKKIQQAHPKIQILVSCPLFRVFLDNNNQITGDSDTTDWGCGTLIDYAEAYKTACEDMKVPFFDMYHNSGINLYTEPYFFPTDDGTHPNENGRHRMGTLLGNKLMELLDNTF